MNKIFATFVLCALLGCGSDAPTGPISISSNGTDSAGNQAGDATVTMDSNTTAADSAAQDAMTVDTLVFDSGAADTGVVDTVVADCGPLDTGSPDTGVADTGPADTGPADTGPADTGPADTGSADTGAVDAGAPSKGACDNTSDFNKLAKSDPTAAITQCVTKCLGGKAACSQCLKQKLDLSDACTDCFADSVDCTVKKCALPCINPSSKGCANCQNSKCIPAFSKCAGITPP